MTPLQRLKRDFENKKVLIMGLGVQGRGIGDAKFLAEIGAKVTVTDLKTKAELETSLKQLKGLPISFILGRHRDKDFKNNEVIIRNPAVPKDSRFLKIAKKAGAQIVMDESLFIRYAPPMNFIGVTGTRGKTTTTILIYEILKATGRRVFLGGNILGMATLPLLRKIKANDWAILELSSWQLQGLADIQFSPQIAVITNIFPDHLNRYSSMRDYVADKKNIFAFQKKGATLFLNKNQKIMRVFAKEAKQSKVIWFNHYDLPSNWELKIPGEHNRQNAAVALRVAQELKIDQELTRKVIESFPGLKYRLEVVAKVKGVTFINDSTSTTPAALSVALQAVRQRIILIAGGASKNLPLKKIAEQVAKQVKGVVLLEGSGTQEFKRLLRKFGSQRKILGQFKSLNLAVSRAVKVSESGDVILLSPGFASFGMFKNEFDRGDQFNKLIKQLVNESKKK